MKNTLLFLTTIFLLITSPGCNNDNIHFTTVEGRVLEFGANIPIEGASVFLDLGTGATSLTSSPVVLRTDTVVILADGRYFFSYETGRYTYAEVYALHDDFFDAVNLPFGIISANANTYDIIMDPHAWLKLHIKNVNPVDEWAQISVNNSFLSGGGGPFVGNNVDTFVIGLVRGNNPNTRAIWFVQRSGQGTKNFNENIYCPAHDTTEFDIFY